MTARASNHQANKVVLKLLMLGSDGVSKSLGFLVHKLLVVVSSVWFASAVASAEPIVWDAAADFRTAGNTTEAPWQYLYMPTSSPNSNYELFPNYGPLPITGPDTSYGWHAGITNFFIRRRPTTPTVLGVHPFVGRAAAIGWRSSVQGDVNVRVSVENTDDRGGNGIKFDLFRSGQVEAVASSLITNGGNELFEIQELSVSPGDVLYAVVDANGAADYDSTSVGFRVSYGQPISIIVGAGRRTQEQEGHGLLAGNVDVVKSGAGTLVLDTANQISSSFSVEQGFVEATDVHALGTATLNVASGATFAIAPEIGSVDTLRIEKLGVISGTLDVGFGRFNLAGLDGAIETTKSLLGKGRNNGGWDGASGIISTAAAADLPNGISRSVGWKENADGSVTVAYAAPGDVNLDGEVNIFDMVDVTSSGMYGEGTASVWSQGDFDYNGVTNIFDMVLVSGAGVYGAGNYLPDPPAVTSVAAVPEPSLGLLALAGLACGVHAGRRGAQGRVLFGHQMG